MNDSSTRHYPLSKEELSLYLACTLNPERKNAYVLGWCLELPVREDEKARTKTRLEKAAEALFEKHTILRARIGQDDRGGFYKYDSGEKPLLEYETLAGDDPAPADGSYCFGIDITGGRLYRVIIS